MAFWDRLKDPFKGIPVVGGALDAVYDTLPIDNAIRMGEEISKGNWGEAAKNLGIGALETASFFLPGSQALKAAGGLGKLGVKQSAKTIAKAAIRPSATAGVNLSRTGKVVTNIVGPSSWKTAAALKGGPTAVRDIVGAMKPAKAVAAGMPRTTGSAASFRMMDQKLSAKKPASPADFRRIEEKQKTDAKRRAQEAARLRDQSRNRTGTGGGAAPVAPAPTQPAPAPAPEKSPEDLMNELGALTVDEQKQFADMKNELQNEYKALEAAFNLRDFQAREAEKNARGLAQNVQAGETQNLLTNLAAIGMEESPGPAIVGRESIAAQSQAEQRAAGRTLADMIAQVDLEKRRAQDSKKLREDQVDSMEKQARIQKTLAALAQMYQQAEEV